MEPEESVWPMNAFYSQELMTWLRNYPGRIVAQFQLGRLYGAAYAKIVTLQNAMSANDNKSCFTTESEIMKPEPVVSSLVNIIQQFTREVICMDFDSYRQPSVNPHPEPYEAC